MFSSRTCGFHFSHEDIGLFAVYPESMGSVDGQRCLGSDVCLAGPGPLIETGEPPYHKTTFLNTQV